MRTPATTSPEKVGFTDFTDKLEDVKSATAEVVQELPIDTEVKTTILISVEENIKKLLSKLANKEDIGWGVDVDTEDFKHLPNSITGVIVHYIVKGIKDDFGLEFEKKPKCLTYNLSKFDKKVAGKKRLLTRDQKNELLAKTQMAYYDDKISSGEMSVEDAMDSIKSAYAEVQAYRQINYILPPKKTDYPYFAENPD